MKILHISESDSGGAGKAALRLHIGLLKQGIDSKMLVLNKSSKVKNVFHVTHFELMRKITFRLFRYKLKLKYPKRPAGLDNFTGIRGIKRLNNHNLIKKTDIINLHWIANFVNYPSFFKSIKNKPIVWTLHDMNPFTGGCHYTGDCKKYEESCESCPQLGSENENDLSKKIFNRKKEAYKGKNINIITLSKWLTNCAKKSNLISKFPITRIPNGLPIDIFRPLNKNKCRELLKLPKDKTIILFGANYKTKRKGFFYLKEALRMIKKQRIKDIALVVFGNCIDSLENINFPTYFLGHFDNEKKLAEVYNAADIFVIPSLEEAFGLTCLESMACGTPVVGFNTGGIPDMIKNGKTGLLAKYKNSKDLAIKIKWMIEHDKDRKKMGINTRKIIENKYRLDIQAKRYIKIYTSILKKIK